VEGDGGNLGRQREDDVEIADRQQVGLALGKPFTRSATLALAAVPVATTNGRFPLAALDEPASRDGAGGRRVYQRFLLAADGGDSELIADGVLQ
jgi:hypothetical protein